jgi:thymidylate kinase
MVLDHDDAGHDPPYPFLITFSGIDGAGKSTQIEYLSSDLQRQGLRVLRFSFWDDVAVWSNMRAGAGLRSASRHSPSEKIDRTFVPRNNKHIRKWYLTAARSGFYMLDVFRLRRLLQNRAVKNSDVIIFDRYIYDQIANIYSRSFVARAYSRILLSQTPAPDLAFILDASPSAAFERKPEYPLEFVYRNRRTFLYLQEIAPKLITIPEGNAENVRYEIYFHISRSRLAAGFSHGVKTQVDVGDCRSAATEFP